NSTFGCFVDHAENVADLDVITLFALDFGQNTVFFRADFEVHLIGFQFDDGFANFDAIPFFLQPLSNRRLDHRFTQFLYNNLEWHSYFSRINPSLCAAISESYASLISMS